MTVRRLRLGAALAVAFVLLGLPAVGPARSAPASADRFAVLVGVDKHRNGSPRTNVGAVGDVKDTRIALERAGWPAANIVELTDSNATAAKIREAMQWLISKSTSRSYSMFHYSGHIKLQDGDPDRDGEARDEFLWPWDSVFISDRELGEKMRAVRGSLWVNISGCQAAGLDDGINAPNRIFTGSSGEFEKSYEHPDWRNSIWTGLLVDQGMNQGRADGNGDGMVSLDEAFRWAAPQATAMTQYQRSGPQRPYANGGNGDWTLRDGPPSGSPPQQEPTPEPPPQPPPSEQPPPPPTRQICAGICISY